MSIPTAFTIPAHATAYLLPDPSLSILGFLKFLFPPPVILSKPRPPLSAYFSADQPNIEDIQMIKTISRSLGPRLRRDRKGVRS